jgi:hypothetical protein
VDTTSGDSWRWVDETLESFVSQLEVNYAPTRITHKRVDFGSFYMSSDTVQTREATPPILMTAAVWSGYRKAEPDSSSVQQSMFKEVSLRVPGYSGKVYGGDVIFPNLKPPK